jgi:hypothetical protein
MRPETTRQLEYRSSKLNALSFICTLQKKQTIIAERTYSCVAQASPGKSTLLRPGGFSCTHTCQIGEDWHQIETNAAARVKALRYPLLRDPSQNPCTLSAVRFTKCDVVCAARSATLGRLVPTWVKSASRAFRTVFCDRRCTSGVQIVRRDFIPVVFSAFLMIAHCCKRGVLRRVEIGHCCYCVERVVQGRYGAKRVLLILRESRTKPRMHSHST